MRKTIMGALAAGTATAAVNIDPATGQGFVGKGDVQTAFSWNNNKLQSSATGVAFRYDTEQHYSATCTWTTGEGTKGERTHNVDHATSSTVNSEIVYDARTHKQIDGFTLTGFGSVTETGEVPVVGGPCMGNERHDGTWSAVTETGSTSGLYVVYNGQAVLIG